MGVNAARIWQRKYARRRYTTDLFVILAAVFGSQMFWFGSSAAELQVPLIELQTFSIGYSGVSVAICVLWLIGLQMYDTRDHKIIGTGVTEYKRLADATLRIFGLVAITMYLFRSELGRGYFLTVLPLGFLLLITGRWAWRQWLVRRRHQGANLYRTLLVGQHKKNVHVANEILRYPSAGLLPVGALTKAGVSDPEVAPGVPVLGKFADIIAVVDNAGADTVVLTGADDIGPNDMCELGWELEKKRVSLVMAPSLTDAAGPRIHARPVAGLPLIHVDYPVFEGTRHVAKRAFDVTASAFALLVLWPIFLWITIVVRRDSPGSALFSQVRVGHNGKKFRMLTFRSMVVDGGRC